MQSETIFELISFDWSFFVHVYFIIFLQFYQRESSESSESSSDSMDSFLLRAAKALASIAAIMSVGSPPLASVGLSDLVSERAGAFLSVVPERIAAMRDE